MSQDAERVKIVSLVEKKQWDHFGLSPPKCVLSDLS